MQITNNHNLPAPVVAAITNKPYVQVGDISVSGIIGPAQKRVLERRHADKITQDAADLIYSLIGKVAHHILELAATDKEIAERRLVMEVNGWKVSGQADLFESLHLEGGLLSDYKTTSVYAFLLADKPEWEKQLNLYRLLFHKHGIEVKKLQIVAILRDWAKSKARREPKYPQVGVHLIDIPVWPIEKAEAYLVERVKYHQDAEKVPDSQLPPCTDEERWVKAGEWAVMKNGQKKAVRLADTEDTAQAIVEAKGLGHFKVYRPGEALRCADYCSAKPFCHQLKKEQPLGVEGM
jgi:hypothetical protein